MGLGNTGNRIFLGVADGKIIQKVTEDTPGAIKRIKDNGAVVWELKHSYIEGLITDIRTKTTEWNGQEIKSWVVTVNDGQDYQLEIRYDSSYATSMFKALGNPVVDFEKPIKLAPYMKVVNDKKKLSIYVSQDGENVEWYFTKDNPNGMPDMVKSMFKGKEVWDNYAQMEFIEKVLVEGIKPKLPKAKPAAQPGNVFERKLNEMKDSSQSGGYDASTAPDEDDLPF